MSAEPAAKPSGTSPRSARIECTLDNDSRLLASLGVFMAHAAQRAGLPEGVQESFAKAGAEVSKEMAAQSDGQGTSTMHLVVEEFPDRLEMAFDSTADSKAGGICKYLKNQIGDRILCEARDGAVRVTLLKPHGEAKSSTHS